MSDGQESVSFDRAAGFYDETRGFPPGVETRVAALVAEAGGLGPASRVLELGVGTGRIALPLAARVREVVGVDRSRPMLEQLLGKRGDRRIRAILADATALPVAARTFDAVLAVHVFHLIPRWRSVLDEAARALRPGGLLLHAADDQSAVWAAWRQRLDAEIGYEHPGVPRARFESFPADEGWVFVPPVHALRFTRTIEPKELLDRMAQRTWSVTWRMRDEELARAVDALRTELVARFGALDRRVEVETGFWVRAFRPPDAASRA